MRTTTTVSLWIVRVAGIVQLVSGALFWTGHAYGYVPLHMISGVLIVLTLWTLAVMALVARARRGLAVFALLWGLALPALGMPQAAILVGPMHWIIRVVHLLMGLSAMGVAFALGRAMLALTHGHDRRTDVDRASVMASRAR